MTSLIRCSEAVLMTFESQMHIPGLFVGILWQVLYMPEEACLEKLMQCTIQYLVSAQHKVSISYMNCLLAWLLNHNVSWIQTVTVDVLVSRLANNRGIHLFTVPILLASHFDSYMSGFLHVA